MKKLLIVSLTTLSCILAGCSSPIRGGNITQVDRSISITANAGFQNRPVMDDTKHVWSEEKSRLNSKILNDAIDKHLQQEQMNGDDYSIQTIITHYTPGLLLISPSEVKTRTDIYDKKGTLIAVIPTSCILDETDWAWKKASDVIADKIITTLKQATGRL